MSLINLFNIKKSFSKTSIINDISLEIPDGKCTVFVGPSGCGKSTLLRLICGLETPDSGEIHIDKQNVTNTHPSKRGLAMVFQSYALYPHMNVFDNIAFGLRVAGIKSVDINKTVLDVSKKLHIEHLLSRKPKELSGGQRQRVAIGRSIVRQPKAFLFDEPLSNLDTELRMQMKYEIAALKESLKTTMIYVTHDQGEAMTLADKIVVLKDGKIEQSGDPMLLYQKPANTFVAGFLGSPKMNFIKAKVMMVETYAVLLSIDETNRARLPMIDTSNITVMDEVILGIRPENISECPIPVCDNINIKTIVTLTENMGGYAYLHVKTDTNNIQMKINGCRIYDIGTAIDIFINPGMCYLFNKEGLALKIDRIDHCITDPEMVCKI